MANDILIFQHADKVETFTAGQHILEEGQSGNVMYAVIEGQVEISVHGHPVETVGPGGIVGEMALIDAHPRSATVIAKTDCKLEPIDDKRFAFLVQQTPFFSLQVMQIMAERLRKIHELIPPR